MRDLVRKFKALSDPNRIRILKMLEVRPLCVCEITEILKLAPSTVSKHLSILRDADFILDEKDGKWVNYRLNEEQGSEQVKKLLPLIRAWLHEDQLVFSDLDRVLTLDRNELCNV